MSSPAPSPATVTTHCPYCALNCGLHLEVAHEKIVGIGRWKDSPLTKGALCSKGVTAHLQVHHGERIAKPLVRRGSDFEEVDWDDALDLAAEGFATIADAHGHHANAVLSGGR